MAWKALRPSIWTPTSSSISSKARRIFGLAGAVVCVIGLVGLSGAMRYSLFGTSVRGKTIEFHAATARSHSVIATVEVELADAAPFRWEIDDWLGIGDWVEGGAAPLRCAHIHSDHVSCLLDSPLEMYLQPLIFIVLGVGAMAIGARRRRA